MTIALIAHDSKKELMVQFCMAYRHILEQHRLLATGTTGRLVEENAGLKVTKFLPGGHGGAEQIVARIACEEVDMLLFFRDPISAKPSEPMLISMELSFRAQWFSVLFSAALVWCNMEYWNAIYRLTGKKLAAWVLWGVCIAVSTGIAYFAGYIQGLLVPLAI